MNLLINRLLFLSLLSLSLSGTPAMGNAFLDVAQDQINKISPKKPVVHKSPLEFKQAVTRYIKYTDNHCLQGNQRYTDENVLYKKELRYLLSNYGKFSSAALLSRLRSAHQAMVKRESNSDNDVYKRYEQISSALLLICAQVFFNDARNQVLDALHELDNLIAYWRYQHHHQVSYFFSKSPAKWVMGKEQEKEIEYNLSVLEHKQRELYTLLGSLTAHVHAFTECDTTYGDCYAWIEELFTVLSCVKSPSHYNADGTQFDGIAVELELKIKCVSALKNDYLSSVDFARKPNHFIRNWIAYTTLVAATAYAVRYHAHNPTVFPAAFEGTQDSAKYLLVLLVDPFNKIYKRIESAFSSKVDSANDIQEKDNQAKKLQDAEAVIKALDNEIECFIEEIPQIANEIASNIADELAISTETARDRIFSKLLKEAIEKVKNPQDGYVYNSVIGKFTVVDRSSYTFDEKKFDQLVNQISIRVSPVVKDGKLIKQASPEFKNRVITNQPEVDLYQKYKPKVDEYEKYQKSVTDLQAMLADLSQQTQLVTAEGLAVCTKINAFDILFTVLDDFAEPLKKYTYIIDKKVLKLIKKIGFMAASLGKRGSLLAKESDSTLQEIRARLQDQELTFWFASLIPLIGTCFTGTKVYQWATKKNYTPIRIALADVNALLIESAMQLDDHDYGKLVYLICKLRDKSKSLKNALYTEFLADVAKLESKRYTAQTKRDIVENMFNKYAFLGRIAA